MCVGVPVHGSKADRGWMESTYDGVAAARKEFGPTLKAQIIENIDYSGVGPALTNLASKNRW
jgi:basic membrane protein A